VRGLYACVSKRSNAAAYGARSVNALVVSHYELAQRALIKSTLLAKLSVSPQAAFR
jgi:hypothetical protein